MNRHDRAKKFLAVTILNPKAYTPGILYSFPKTWCNNSNGIFSRRCTVYLETILGQSIWVTWYLIH